MITISVSDKNIRVASPYNPEFVAGAKRLGARWSAPVWIFDARDEDRVRDLCREVYGDDGRGLAQVCTLRLRFVDDYTASCDAVRIAGREVARAFGRDSGAKLGEGAVLLEGSINSGGSAKNWKTLVRQDSIILLRDVPVAIAERAVASPPADVEVSIEPEVGTQVDRAALAAERERLSARIAEIDALLAAEG